MGESGSQTTDDEETSEATSIRYVHDIHEVRWYSRESVEFISIYNRYPDDEEIERMIEMLHTTGLGRVLRQTIKSMLRELLVRRQSARKSD